MFKRRRNDFGDYIVRFKIYYDENRISDFLYYFGESEDGIDFGFERARAKRLGKDEATRVAKILSSYRKPEMALVDFVRYE